LTFEYPSDVTGRLQRRKPTLPKRGSLKLTALESSATKLCNYLQTSVYTLRTKMGQYVLNTA
jgi:hypothetical protein